MFALLVILAVIFVVAVVGSYIWGVGYLVFTVNQAVDSQTVTSTIPQFDLQGAAKLNYRGTLQETP